MGVQFKDARGGFSVVYKDFIVVSTASPQGIVVLNAGAVYTPSNTVTASLKPLQWWTLPGATGAAASAKTSPQNANAIPVPLPMPVPVPYMRLGEYTAASGLVWGPWESFSEAKTLTLSAGTGAKQVYAQLRDAAGNVSETIGAAITVDPGAIQSGIYSIAIDGGRQYRAELEAGIDIYVRSRYVVTQMRLGPIIGYGPKGNPIVTWRPWEPLSTGKLWHIPPGEGTYTVMAGFATSDGTVVGKTSDTIICDEAPPTPWGLSAPGVRTLSLATGTFTATSGVEQIVLRWPGFTDNLSAIYTYLLYAGTTSGPDAVTGTLIYQGLSTDFTHTDLQPGKIYYYSLYAVDGAGNPSAVALTAQAVPQSGKSVALPFLFLLLED